MTDKLHVPKLTSHARTKRVYKKLTSNVWFLIIALAACGGFFVGANTNQVIGFVGPIFGQKVYAGNVDLSSVEATYRSLKANYDGTLTDKALIEGANKGLVAAAGDTYTLYMNSSEANSFSDDLSGNIGGGVGAELGVRSGKLTVLRVLAANPAEKAGMAAGDVITKVNDQSAADWTVEKAVAAIRGDVGTTVKITTDRSGQTKEFTITRDTITSPSVDSSETGGLGILTISRFDSETASLARQASEKFKIDGVKSVILDLRGNGGGYIDAAQAVASLWLKDQVVVTERTGGTVVDQLKSGNGPILAGLPTVVLVDGNSASASEIVAGALQDYKAAKLVGEKTFGKGSVQKLISLPQGAELKVTIARWYTPNGKNITKEGITPDITATLSLDNVNNGVDPQLDAAKKALGL
jgi:carboxyl-terminal processing protease